MPLNLMEKREIKSEITRNYNFSVLKFQSSLLSERKPIVVGAALLDRKSINGIHHFERPLIFFVSTHSSSRTTLRYNDRGRAIVNPLFQILFRVPLKRKRKKYVVYLKKV